MCRLTIRIWGPAKGSELELTARASEAAIEARACARRGLRHSLPRAVVVGSTVAREMRDEGGRATPGYLITLTIETPTPSHPGGAEWLRLRVESDVAVALLELLSPMVIDGVRVTG